MVPAHAAEDDEILDDQAWPARPGKQFGITCPPFRRDPYSQAVLDYVVGWHDGGLPIHMTNLDEAITIGSGARLIVFGHQIGLQAEHLPTQIADAFRELADEWKLDTMTSSSITEICSHWAYQRVIGLGAQAVPVILNDVADGTRHWSWALAAITGENPAEDAETPRAASDAWLSWGRQRGLISDGPG